MGWNKGYEILESTVVGAYDSGKLDRELLSILMEPYRDTDIDSGGSQGLLSNDGKDVVRIVVETWGLEMPDKLSISANDEQWDEYEQTVYRKFKEVTSNFGW